VVGCHVVLEPHTRVSRGFAFVTMDTVEEADRCIKYLNNSVMEGRNITVEKVIVFTVTRVVDTNSATTYVLCVDLEVFFGYYSEDTVQDMCSNQDSEFINFSFSKLQLDQWTAQRVTMHHKIHTN